jgi:ribonuclease HI
MSYTIITSSPLLKSTLIYLLQFDGSAIPNPGIVSYGAILYSLDLQDNKKKIIFEAGGYKDIGTNNQAEYLGLCLGLKIAIKKQINFLRIEGDSLLVCNQIMKKWKVKNKELEQYFKEAQELLTSFEYVEIKHIYRQYNSLADALGREAFATKCDFYREY